MKVNRTSAKGTHGVGRGEQVLIGEAPSFRRVISAVQVVSATDVNVLILGESGAGKEMLARTIHGLSRRSSAPFVVVKCADISEESFKAELIAHYDRAAGGTLFLDEISDVPLISQGKLLGFVEGRNQVGPDEQAARARVIATSSRDLWAAVENGDFRRDLYYRLCVVPLEVPPLRERVQDIPLLLSHFVAEAANTHDLKPPRFNAGAERLLRRYRWPGNVREVRNFAERMVILFAGREVSADNLPWEIRRDCSVSDDAISFRLPESGINLEQLEVDVIRQALTLAGGNKSRAARLLGLTRDTLLYRIQKYLIRA
jgi:DNA-binding NtrC family response regulator